METGKIIHRFTAKDGREVILRTPRLQDLDDLTELINSLVDEGAEIPNRRKVTKEKEAELLKTRLDILEKSEGLDLVLRSTGR